MLVVTKSDFTYIKAKERMNPSKVCSMIPLNHIMKWKYGLLEKTFVYEYIKTTF